MRPLKKILKSSPVQNAAAFLLSLYIRLVYLTSKKIRHYDDASMPYVRGEDNAIFAFWHGRMMIFPPLYPIKRRKLRVLISRHSDGALISKVIAHFNLATVSGSTSKGGAEAASEILEALAQGDNIGITPDGPRGPAHIATRGVAALARLSQKPVIPVTFASSRTKYMKSWDRFALALPFGRIVIYVGAPMVLSRTASDEEEEAMRKHVEQAMNELTAQAEHEAHE